MPAMTVSPLAGTYIVVGLESLFFSTFFPLLVTGIYVVFLLKILVYLCFLFALFPTSIGTIICILNVSLRLLHKKVQ